MVDKRIEVNITDNIRKNLSQLSDRDFAKAKTFIQEFSEYLQVYWFRNKHIFACDLGDFNKTKDLKIELYFNETSDPEVLLNSKQDAEYVAIHNDVLPNQKITVFHRERSVPYITKRIESTRLLLDALVALDFTQDLSNLLTEFKTRVMELDKQHFIFEPPSLYEAGFSLEAMNILGTRVARSLGQDERVFENAVKQFIEEMNKPLSERVYKNRLVVPIVTENFAVSLREVTSASAAATSSKAAKSSPSPSPTSTLPVSTEVSELVSDSGVKQSSPLAAAVVRDGNSSENKDIRKSLASSPKCSPLRLSEARQLALTNQSKPEQKTNFFSQFFSPLIQSTVPTLRLYTPGLSTIAKGATAVFVLSLGYLAMKRISAAKSVDSAVTNLSSTVQPVRNVVATGARQLSKAAKSTAAASGEVVVKSVNRAGVSR